MYCIAEMPKVSFIILMHYNSLWAMQCDINNREFECMSCKFCLAECDHQALFIWEKRQSH